MKKNKLEKIVISGAIAVLAYLGVQTSALPEIAEQFFSPKATVERAPTPKGSENIGAPKQEQARTNDTIDQSTYQQLAHLDFQSGTSASIDVNDNKSTLDLAEWHGNKVVYGALDSLNRTTNVTAYLDRKNLGHSEGRQRQVWKPTGWHQKKVDGKEIYNRGHLLAYTSSFNFDEDGTYKQGALGSIDNPKNLATQSAFSNQHVQTYYETLVRNAQKIRDNKVVFQIVTVFRGNELMPRGYWLQAKDSTGQLNFNVYEFNVQPHVQFNYSDGTSKIDRTMNVTFTKK